MTGTRSDMMEGRRRRATETVAQHRSLGAAREDWIMEYDGQPRRCRGFTLIELVTTAAIFGILGIMLFSMVKSSMDMWSSGEAQREEVEKSSLVLETIARELRACFTENDPGAQEAQIRFHSDFVDYDLDRDGTPETRLQRLFFVRINSEEKENLELREAGDVPLGSRYFTLANLGADVRLEPGDELAYDAASVGETIAALGGPAEEDLLRAFRPTGGLAEALFMAFPQVVTPKDPRKKPFFPTLTFMKGYRSPIGGEDSFFAPGMLLKGEEVPYLLAPIFDGLLHLEFRFADQETFSFDESVIPALEAGGAGYVWDSTRGIMPDEDDGTLNMFRLALGPGSTSVVSDDIFPARVQVSVTIAAGGSREPIARVVRNVKDDERRIPVDVVRPFSNWRFGERWARIESEWVRFSSIEGKDLVVSERGGRRTIPRPHRKGSPVYVGRTFTAQIAIPAAKEFWNAIEN